MKYLELSDVAARDMARAFDASPNPYTMLTADFCYAGVNQAYLDVVGRSREELIGRNLFDLFDGGGQDDQARENARQLKASFERVLKTGQPDHLALIHYPIEITDADGRTRIEDRYWSATHTPIRDVDGQVAYILQHTTDITELQNLRKRVMGDRDKASVADLLSSNVMARAEHVQSDNLRLQSERNRLLDIFMQAPGFIAVLTGPDFVFQMHNEAYAELVGRRDLTGRPLVEALPEVPAQGFLDLLRQVRETGEVFEGRAMAVQLGRGPSREEYARDGSIHCHANGPHPCRSGHLRRRVSGPPDVAVPYTQPADADPLGGCRTGGHPDARDRGPRLQPHSAKRTVGVAGPGPGPVAGDDQVSLVWREIDGPPVGVTEHRGFGSRLIERNVRHDLAGQSRFDYAPDGLIFSLTFPLERTAS